MIFTLPAVWHTWYLLVVLDQCPVADKTERARTLGGHTGGAFSWVHQLISAKYLFSINAAALATWVGRRGGMGWGGGGIEVVVWTWHWVL